MNLNFFFFLLVNNAVFISLLIQMRLFFTGESNTVVEDMYFSQTHWLEVKNNLRTDLFLTNIFTYF